jgi:hypothetical protein
MFDTHQPLISKFAIQNEDNFFQVLQFVLLTIQQPLFRAVIDMDVVNEDGIEARCLWGGKLAAWVKLKEEKTKVYDHCMLLNDVHPNPEHASSELLGYLASLPGLGLVKGGFVAQLAFGLVGCLDTHNINRYGLKKSSFAAHAYKGARTPQTRHKIVNRYLAVCSTLGGVQGLWDSWCEYVNTSTMFRGTYESAEHVSAMHCKAFGITV